MSRTPRIVRSEPKATADANCERIDHGDGGSYALQAAEVYDHGPG